MKIFNGTVVSTSMAKTVVVQVVSHKRHKLYKRLIRVSKRFKADCDIAASIGDIVAISETKPMSKDKHFKVIKVIRKAEDK